MKHLLPLMLLVCTPTSVLAQNAEQADPPANEEKPTEAKDTDSKKATPAKKTEPTAEQLLTVIRKQEEQIKTLDRRIYYLERRTTSVPKASPSKTKSRKKPAVATMLATSGVLAGGLLLALRNPYGRPDTQFSSIKPQMVLGTVMGGAASTAAMGAGIQLGNNWIVGLGGLGAAASLVYPFVLRSQVVGSRSRGLSRSR